MMSILDNELKTRIKCIDDSLNYYLKTAYPAVIYEAMQYSVLAGGKRMRPILLLSTCETLGGDIDSAMPFACAIEMIHTYSLIHDDLPCMDDDDLRRGKPTNHKMFGEAMALLAGDALLNKAYEIMSTSCKTPEAVKSMRSIAQSAGTGGMIGGQVMDLLCEDKTIDEDTLLYIHENKTAALIKSAILAGVYLSGSTEDVLLKLGDMATNFGIAFQIKDDILDVVSDSKTLGKPIGSDDKNKKNTYVTIHGLDKAHADYDARIRGVFNVLDSMDIKHTFLYRYIHFLADRKF